MLQATLIKFAAKISLKGKNRIIILFEAPLKRLVRHFRRAEKKFNLKAVSAIANRKLRLTRANTPLEDKRIFPAAKT